MAVPKARFNSIAAIASRHGALPHSRVAAMLRPLATSLALLIAMTATIGAGAADIYIFNFITADVFAHFCDDLQLSAAQRLSAQAEYEKYVAAVQDTNDRSMDELKRISDEVPWAEEGYLPQGYESLQPNMTRGRKFRLPEQHLEVSERSAQAMWKSLRETGRIEDALFHAIDSTLTPAQHEGLAAAIAAVHRRVVFERPRHARAVQDDLGTALPDLCLMIEEASHGDGELRRYLDGAANGDDAVNLVRSETALAVDEFQVQFSAAIEGAFESHFRRSLDLMRALAAKDMEARRRVDRAAYKEWRRRFDAIDRPSRRIATALQAAGDAQAAEAWLDRVNAVWYPNLFQQESSEALHGWMHQQALPDETRAAADALLAKHRSARRGLREQAMSLRLRLRESAPDMYLDPEPRSVLKSRRDDIDAQRRALCDRTNRSLRVLLPGDELKSAFDARLEEFRRMDRPTSDPPP